MAKKNKKNKEAKATTGTAVFGGGVGVDVAAAAALAEKLNESADKSPRGGSVDFMNFSGKSGAYSIGMDKRGASATEMWVVNITSFMDGWVLWKNKTPTHRMANVMDTPVAAPEDGEGGPFSSEQDGWFAAKGFTLKSLADDTQASFTLNSKGGVSAIADFQKDIASRMIAGEDAWPVIKLGNEQFTSAGYTNYKPKFDIVGWLSNAQIQELMEDTSGAEAMLGLTKKRGDK